MKQTIPKAQTDWAAWLTRGALALALVLVCARGTMNTSVRDTFTAAPGLPAAPAWAGPASSLFMDLLFCLPSLLILARRAIDRTYIVRLSISHLPMGLLAAWMLASTCWAGDKFAALVTAADFVAALVLLWSMSQLVRSWQRLRMAAAVGVAVLLLYVAAGLEYRLVDLPLQREEYQKNPAQTLRNMGLETGSFAAGQFEKKLMGGDVGRFANSANTYASALVLMAVIGGGVIAQRLAYRQRAAAIALGAVMPLVLLLMWYTHSRTAFGVAGLAGVLALVLWLRGQWIARRARALYWAGVGAFVLAVAAVAGHGLAHGNLVDRSLTFRWYYWTGAAKLVRQHPIIGVGWSNFGPRYLAVRGPLAVEEPQDPHNFIVRAFAELGVVGGVLMLAWMARLWWELSRPVWPVIVPAATNGQTNTDRRRHRHIIYLVMLAALAMGLNYLIGTDFSQDSDWMIWQAFRSGAGVILLAGGLMLVAIKDLAGESLDQRPGPRILCAMVIAAGVFLLHSLIDFALFEPAPLFLFALVAGSALGARQPSLVGHKRQSDKLARTVLAAAGMAWMLAALLIWLPTARAELAAAQGDQLVRERQFPQAYQRYAAAMAHQPRNGDYALRAATALVYQRTGRAMVHGTLEAAIAADPTAIRYFRFMANYELEQPMPNGAVIHYAMKRALELDPRNVGMRLDYAKALAKLGDKAGALEQYGQAMVHDDALPPNEPKRLSDKQRDEIDQAMAGLK